MIRRKFIPALLGREVNDLERELFSLPARYGGLGIGNPCVQSARQYTNSEELTTPLVALIQGQKHTFDAKKIGKAQKKIRKSQMLQATIGFEKSLAAIKEKAPRDQDRHRTGMCERGLKLGDSSTAPLSSLDCAP